MGLSAPVRASKLYTSNIDGLSAPFDRSMITVIRELGRGSFGVVWLVRFAGKTGLPFAMKEIQINGTEDVRYFEREVRATSQVRWPCALKLQC
jgi:serine/threonine protein kinase